MQASVAVVEGDLARQSKAGEEIEVPERFQRSTEIAAPLGRLAPVASTTTAAASLAVSNALGLFDLGSVDELEWLVGAVVLAGRAVYSPIRERDDQHDRMRRSHPAPEGPEVVERYPTTPRLMGGLLWYVVKWTGVLVAVAALLHVLDTDWDKPWPVILGALVAGGGVAQLIDRAAIRSYEREHGVELLQEADWMLLDDEEDDDEEEDDDDPFGHGPMFHRPAGERG